MIAIRYVIPSLSNTREEFLVCRAEFLISISLNWEYSVWNFENLLESADIRQQRLRRSCQMAVGWCGPTLEVATAKGCMMELVPC